MCSPFFVWFKFEGWILHSSPLPCLGTVASTSPVDRACAHMRRAQRPPFQAGPFTGRSNEIKWTGCFPSGGPSTLDLVNKKKTQLPWPRMAAGSLIFQVFFFKVLFKSVPSGLCHPVGIWTNHKQGLCVATLRGYCRLKNGNVALL